MQIVATASELVQGRCKRRNSDRRSGALLLPHVPHVLDRVHQRQLLRALIAVSYVGVEELGFLFGEVFSSQARRVGQVGQVSVSGGSLREAVARFARRP